MEKKDILQLLTIIGQTYNYFKFPKDDKKDNDFMVSTWHKILGHLDSEIVFAALKEHIAHETEVPTPAHVMQKVKRMTTNQMDGNQAWSKLNSAIGRYGSYRAIEAMESLPKPIQDTVRLMGGIELFCRADEGDTYLKNSFVKNYEQAVEVEERERLLPEGVREQRRLLLEKFRGGNNVKMLL